jgi:short-subunit dehydrogenase
MLRERYRSGATLIWNLEGGVAVITGAGSGIGRALAKRLAVERMSLALVDVDQSGVEVTARHLTSTVPGKAVTVSVHLADVGDAKQMERVASEVMERHKRVTLLVNNAAVALHGTVEEISLADIDWVMRINFWGLVHGVKCFLPILRRERRAHIVNLSSVFGLIGFPGQSAYAASKFAVRGFSEVLQHELEGTSIGVSCVHPGKVRTEMGRRARIPAGIADRAVIETHLAQSAQRKALTPEAAAALIVEGIKRGRTRIVAGRDAIWPDRLQRAFPVRYSQFIRWLQRLRRQRSRGHLEIRPGTD